MTRIALHRFGGLFLLTIGMMATALGADFDYRLAVVKIIAKGDQGAEKQGTGFIVDISKNWIYIITASHVVVGDLHPTIEFLNSDEPPVQVLGTIIEPENENRHGLALIKTQVTSSLPPKLAALSLAENSDVQDLDPILVVGYPQAAQAFLQTRGYVAGREGQLLLIQPPLGEGNSGGPVGRNGRVIGLVTATAETYAYCTRVEAIRQYLAGVGLKLTTQASPLQPGQGRVTKEQPQQPQRRENPQQQSSTVPTAGPPWPTNAKVSQPGPGVGKDIWVTSVYSYAPGGGGPGGGLNDEELVVGGWGDSYYSLLQFDLRGMPPAARLAKLELFCFKSRGTSTVGMLLDRIVEPWDWRTQGSGSDRERLWWADRPRAVQWRHSILPPCSLGTWSEIDITDLYNAWQNGTYENYGLQLRPAHNDNRWNEFYSSKYLVNPSLRPRLIVQR